MHAIAAAALLLLLLAGGRKSVSRGTGGGSRPVPDLARALAAKWGAAFKVPPAWVLATMDHESGFRPDLKNLTGGDLSRGGAWGLMQVTYETARDEAGKMDKDAPAAARAVLAKWDRRLPQGLLDPEVNAAIGTSHLARLSRDFGGDWRKVAAAYNHGSAGVKRALARGGLEELPEQVRRYVATAEERLARYA